MQRTFHIRPLMAVLALVFASVVGGLVAGYMNGSHPSAVSAASPAASGLAPGELVTFAPVVKKATPAVVNISSTKVIKAPKGQGGDGNPFFSDPFFRQFFGNNMPFNMTPKDRREQSLGSGVIVNSDGYILTNNHVVEGANEVKVYLSDKREFKAKVVGTDKQTDIAVVKIDATNLPTLPIHDSSKPEVGDVCLAIGNPFGLGQTVTMGIIGATGRTGLGIEDYENFIQTDAAINPGNSGGALINTKGELIGINTAILSGSGGNQGIGFAIPVTMAASVMHQIEEHGKVTRGYVGATIQQVDADLAKAFGIPETSGVALTQIEPDSPAAKAGLKAGDVVVEMNGEPVKDASAFRLKIADMGPGATTHLKVYRNGKPMDFTLTLAERPSDEALSKNTHGMGPGTQSALQGVSVETLTSDIARQLGLNGSTKGVVVTDVDQDSAAAAAGLHQGDVIQQVNRQPVTSASEFERLVHQSTGNGTLLLVNRGGNTMFMAIESK